MKKLFIFFALVVLFSCQKESCYQCSLTSTTTTRVTKCDMTEKEIDAFERQQTSSGVICICTKQ